LSSIISENYRHVNRSINASKSVIEFFAEFFKFKSFSNNYIVAEQYIVFDNIKPILYEDIGQLHLTLQRFYKYSKESRNLANLIALYYYKYTTDTKIEITKGDTTTTITNPYKEFERAISITTDKDYTHLMTITYSAYAIFLIEDLEEQLFRILEKNDEIRKWINRGLHRLRNAIASQIRRNLKKKGIKDKQLLNNLVRQEMDKVFKYFKVYELHKSGIIHVHILIKLPKFIRKRKFEKIIELLAKMFNTTPNGVDLKRIKDKKAISYVAKYLTKGGRRAEPNMFYVMKNGIDKVFFIKKEAFIKNDIPRLTSNSRNVNTVRLRRENFSYKVEPRHEEEIILVNEGHVKVVKRKKREGKEAERIQRRDLIRLDENRFRKVLEQFKTKREKQLEREIERGVKRAWAIDVLQGYIDSRYWSIKNVIKAVDYAKTDEILQKRYNALIHRAVIQINKDLKELEAIVNEYDDDWVDF